MSLLRNIFNRSIKFTREGLGFILLTLAIGTAAINTGNNLLYLILAAMLSMIIISGILSEGCLRRVEVERRFPMHLFASTPFPLRVGITNRKRFLSSFSLSVKEITKMPGSGEARLFRIPPRKTSHASYMGCFEKRGRNILEGIILSTLFPFGFFIKSEKRISPCEIIVYPRIDRLPNFLKAELSTIGNISEEKKKGRGNALFNIRDYRAGEDSRSIHWKSTARQSRLMIKEFEKEEERTIMLFLVNRIGGPISIRDMDNFERGVELTASLAGYFLKKDYPVGFFSFGSHIPPAQGEKHLHRVLKELALLEINSNKESPEQTFIKLTRYNGTNILILPWDYKEVICAGLIFSRTLRIGIDA